jgi:hypothetical protein
LYSRKKTINDKILSETNKIIILNELLNKNELDLIILFSLVFEYGFSIHQVSLIKVKSINFQNEINEITNKGKRKRRLIKYEISKIISDFINKKELKAEQYLLYDDFISTKSFTQKKFYRIFFLIWC